MPSHIRRKFSVDCNKIPQILQLLDPQCRDEANTPKPNPKPTQTPSATTKKNDPPPTTTTLHSQSPVPTTSVPSTPKPTTTANTNPTTTTVKGAGGGSVSVNDSSSTIQIDANPTTDSSNSSNSASPSSNATPTVAPANAAIESDGDDDNTVTATLTSIIDNGKSTATVAAIGKTFTSDGRTLFTGIDSAGAEFTATYAPDPITTDPANVVTADSESTAVASPNAGTSSAASSSNHAGAIAGGIIGALAFIVLIVVLLALRRRRRAKRIAPSTEFLTQNQYPFSGSTQFRFQRAGSYTSVDGSVSDIRQGQLPSYQDAPAGFVSREKTGHV